MKTEPLVSILINNYNYDRFLTAAIDSALAQTYFNIEVIVVDDGSTDKSRNIIAGYGDQIISVLKNNSGQASSLNAGFNVCKGKIICFLDSDDLFHHEKVEKIVDLFAQNNLIDLPIALHNMFEPIDEKGLLMETNTIRNFLSEQDFEWRLLSKIIGSQFSFFDGEISKLCTNDQAIKFAHKYRYIPYIGMPTSSISVSRDMAEKVFPLPLDRNRILKGNADHFLTKAASLIGMVYSTNLALTQYRFHENGWHTKKVTQEAAELELKLKDDFLNLKLKEMDKEPVFSFFQSMQASGFYRCYFGYNSGDRLLKLAFDLMRWNPDFTHSSFFVRTFTQGFYYKLKAFYNDSLSQKNQLKS